MPQMIAKKLHNLLLWYHLYSYAASLSGGHLHSIPPEWSSLVLKLLQSDQNFDNPAADSCGPSQLY